ncbi:MAG: uridine kinase [Jatrophihabitans sp.]|uniref:uridine kinase n=1 Tax=Jatrophihabitans sp. TaxID=1932789 RepID=UPI003F7EFDC0
MTPRAQVIDGLAAHLASLDPGHPLRVGIDGPCGSGKSTLARELVDAVGRRGRPVVHLDSDGFHHVRAVRYRQGRDSARGYYEDAYDFAALVDRVLVPLGPGGSRHFATKVHDLASDRVETDLVDTAAPDTIAIFDCTFLQRGSLRDHWDHVIYLDVRRDIAVARGVARDAAALGGVEPARRAYDERYMAACDLYLQEERPAQRADVVIDHDDVEHPEVRRGLGESVPASPPAS